MGGVFLLALAMGAPEQSMGQVRPAPAVHWRAIDWDDERPGFGQNHVWDASISAWVDSQQTEVEEQTRDDSGEEWNYAHAPVKDGNGMVIGYATAGYGTVVNWTPGTSGCEDIAPDEDKFDHEFSSAGPVKGIPRGVVAMYDLNGARLWYRSMMVGLAYGITVDLEGNIVVVGGGRGPQEYPDMPQVPIHWNGGTVDISAVGWPAPDPCPQSYFRPKPYMAKYNQQGELLWLEMFGDSDDALASWPIGGEFCGVSTIEYGGQTAYMAVGYTGLANGNGGAGFAVRVDADGQLIDRHSYGIGDPIWEAQGVSDAYFVGGAAQIRIQAIAADLLNDQVAFVGHFRNTATGATHAFLMALDLNSTTPYSPVFPMRNTYQSDDPVFLSYHANGKKQNTTGVQFVIGPDAITRIVWPVLADFPTGLESTDNDIPAGKSIARLIVHGLTDGTLDWTTDLGEVRAYDLQADACPLSNGDVAVVSTKWARPYYFDLDEGYEGITFGYNDLPAGTQECLDDRFNDFFATCGEYFFSWWNTDCYVARLNSMTGEPIWETRFDAEPATAFECWPGDIRNQECMYKISEAPDGGLVVSGNTSHNFDDYYLAKLQPDCQSNAGYSVFENAWPFDGGNAYAYENNEFVHTVDPDGETWLTDMNVHGIIRVPSGVTLTITNGAVIRFADSRLLDHPTWIEVEAGGDLVITDAELTSLPGCSGQGPMWDGILVMGDANESQDVPYHANQGRATFREATVRNARTGVITANAWPRSYIMADVAAVASGGIVRVWAESRFNDCNRDVVLSPYDNYRVPDHNNVQRNRSSFYNSTFAVDAALNDGSRPAEHILLYGVRNIPILGCTFSGHPLLATDAPTLQDIGTGVRGLNSSFIIGDYCTQPQLNYGDPCGGDIIHNTFDKLRHAVDAKVATEPSKTVSVDHAIITHCPAGIRIEGMADAAITGNEIAVPDFQDNTDLGTPYGLYSNECTGYEIEDNVITVDGTTGRARAGIVIKDSGPYSNVIYNNKVDGFDYLNSTAILLQGENADPNDLLTGTEVKCNELGQEAVNRYDVAITWSSSIVRKLQGHEFGSQTDWSAPAGNFFSQQTGTDRHWHSENDNQNVTYYHHDGTTEPWVPQYFTPLHLAPLPTLGWPTQAQGGRNAACPSNQRSRDRERSMMVSGSEEKDEELQASRDAYDAAKDDGDTYSLLGYVSDPTKSSTQVRNALQSVAPMVSADVWQVAFERVPSMNQWHLTQALLSNSPLQTEVLKLCYESELSDYNYNLVAVAQNGINPLTSMESAIANKAGGKALDLTDLGRWSWLDTTNVDSLITLLKLWHDQMPSENGDEVLMGYHLAKGDMTALHALATGLMNIGSRPEYYGLMKRFAEEQLNLGWLEPSTETRTWLQQLAQERWTAGSAMADAWLEALGAEPLEELVILPAEERSVTVRMRRTREAEPALIEAFPNPTDGMAYFACNAPEGSEQVLIRIRDVEGRVLREQRLGSGASIVEVDLMAMSSGVYIAELRAGEVVIGQVKVTRQ